MIKLQKHPKKNLKVMKTAKILEKRENYEKNLIICDPLIMRLSVDLQTSRRATVYIQDPSMIRNENKSWGSFYRVEVFFCLPLIIFVTRVLATFQEIRVIASYDSYRQFDEPFDRFD